MTSKQSPMIMGATMDTDWKPGSKYTLKGEFNGKKFTDYGEIEHVDPGRELTFTHWSETPKAPESYNAVKYTLSAHGKGTKVTLEQFSRGRKQAFDDKQKAEFKKNWSMMLDGLKTAAEA
jgi:uncharacterized protein YndB with AHSA1/START domain